MNLTLYLSRLRGLCIYEKMALQIVVACYRARAPCQLRIEQWAVSLSCQRRRAIMALGWLERNGWVAVTRRWSPYANIYEPGPKLQRVLSKLLSNGGGKDDGIQRDFETLLAVPPARCAGASA